MVHILSPSKFLTRSPSTSNPLRSQSYLPIPQPILPCSLPAMWGQLVSYRACPTYPAAQPPPCGDHLSVIEHVPRVSNLFLHPLLPSPHSSHPNWPTPMAAASAGGSLSTASASLVPTPTSAPAPRLLSRRSTKPTTRASPTPRPKKPPPLSCAAAATPTPAPAVASKSAGSWRDLCSLNAWVVRDYRRLVDSVGALEPALRRLSDEQVACGTNTPPPLPLSASGSSIQLVC